MSKIAGRFHEVRAWNGIPGIDVDMTFAVHLRMAGVPVAVYTKVPARRERQPQKQVGHTGWSRSGGFGSLAPDIVLPSAGDFVDIPAIEAYRVATPLAQLEPDAELAIWAAYNFAPDELASIYKLQEAGTWPQYVQELKDQSEDENG